MSEYLIEKKLILNNVEEISISEEKVLVRGADKIIKEVDKSSLCSDSVISVTKSELDDLVNNNSLIPGAYYEISGVHPSLYDDGSGSGTKIFLKALASDKLAKSGHGLFWNPKYDKTIEGFGIYDYLTEFTATELNVFRYLNSYYGSSGKGSAKMYLDNTTGNLYIANMSSNYISRITPKGSSENISIPSFGSEDITMDSAGNLWAVSDADSKVMKIEPSGKVTVVGNFLALRPKSLVIDSNDNVFVTSVKLGAYGVYKITPAGVVTFFASTSAFPASIIIDADDNLYTANADGGNINKITPAGMVTVFGTTPTTGYQRIFMDSAGDIFAFNGFDRKIAKVYANGNPSIVFKDGYSGFYMDSNDNIFASDYSFQDIYKIAPDATTTLISRYDRLQAMIENADGDYYIIRYSLSYGSVNRLYDVNTPIPFYYDEPVTADNGATGTLVRTPSSGLLVMTTGDWAAAKKIIGNYSHGEANIADIVIKKYSIGDKAIWGGYLWENLNGSDVIAPVNVLNLYDNEWIKLPYDSTNYNQVLDEIEYDIQNDWISRRRDVKNNNDVSIEYTVFNTGNISEFHPIATFMFGNDHLYNDEDAYYMEVGVSGNTVKNSSLECINFRGAFFTDNTSITYSALYDNHFMPYAVFTNNYMDTWSYMFANVMVGQSRISDNKLSGSSISQNTIKNDGSGNFEPTIGGNKLDSNSRINRNIYLKDAKMYDNNLDGSGFEENNLTDATINENTLLNSTINSNKLTMSCQIYRNILTESTMNANNMDYGSSLSSNNGHRSQIDENLMLSASGIQYNILASESAIRSHNLTNVYISKNRFDQTILEKGVAQYVNISSTEFTKANIDMELAGQSFGLLFQDFPKTIYSRPDYTIKMRYYDNDDNLVISDITD